MGDVLHLIRRVLRRALDAAFLPYFTPYFTRHSSVDKGSQILLTLKYKQFLYDKRPLPTFGDVGFRAYSQNDEDGILLYIFALIGTTNRRAVEVCAGNGIERNTANLIVNHGWTALLFDGDKDNVSRGQSFYSRCRDTFIFPPTFVHAWIEAENINTLISDHGFHGEIDLIVIDLDGMDYWVWKAIQCVSPRVVVVEYHNIWGPDKSVTVPYQRNFNRFDTHPDYCGASLPALVKLGRQKGYRLVACNRYGFNAFFMRNDIAEELFPEVSADSCLEHPMAIQGRETRLPQVINFKWIEV